MGRSGPRPQPTNVVELHGNPGKRKRAPEPRPKPAKSTEPPKDLTAAEKQVWESLAPRLDEVGLLTSVDLEMFRCLVEAIVIRRATVKALRAGREYVLLARDTNNGGEPRRHPAFIMYVQADARVQSLGREFGLTPSARVGLPGDGDDGDEDDDLFD